MSVQDFLQDLGIGNKTSPPKSRTCAGSLSCFDLGLATKASSNSHKVLQGLSVAVVNDSIKSFTLKLRDCSDNHFFLVSSNMARFPRTFRPLPT